MQRGGVDMKKIYAVIFDCLIMGICFYLLAYMYIPVVPYHFILYPLEFFIIGISAGYAINNLKEVLHGERI